MIALFINILCRIVNRVVLLRNHVQIGKYHINGKVKIYRDLVLKNQLPNQSIFIGDNFICNSGIKYNPIGGDSCSIIRTLDDGVIRIGNNVGMSNASLVAWKCIEIGDNVLIGGGVKIYDTDFHPIEYDKRVSSSPLEGVKSARVVIEEGAFIGANSIILKGVTIGKHSIIGAGAVVTTNVPSGEIWAGNPARFVRKIED